MPSRIPAHKPLRLVVRSRRDESGRPNAAARGYCSKAHRAWRLAVLTRDAWTCRDCGRVCDRSKRDAHADHVVPISQGGDRYDVGNGACRCAACHARKTLAERRDANRGRAGSLEGRVR